MRIIEVVTDAGYLDTLVSLAEQQRAADCWTLTPDQQGRCCVRMLVSPGRRQPVLDALQTLLGANENTRILVLPVEAALPRAEEDDADSESSVSASREELYEQMERGARLDSNYLLMVLLSSIVVAIGLIRDSVAVVVGGMVIAPLLGPNICFAFAASLGDMALLWRALKTSGAGLGLALLITLLIGWLLPVGLESHEIQLRTEVGLDTMLLALVSGAAAVYSITAGAATALVGVMVAVALLPPAATMGMLLASGLAAPAMEAGLMLVINLVCVVLSAMLVFLVKGIRPRTWLAKKKAQQSSTLNIVLWLVIVLSLLALLILRRQVI